MSYQLSELRTYFQQITHTANDSNIAGSTYELQLLNKAYEKSAYKYDWPQTLKRYADAIVANVDRYALQSDFRKFKFLRVKGTPFDETDVEHIISGTIRKFAVTLDTSEYILSDQPTSASTAYTTSNSESAGNSVVVELDSVSGIAAGDEVFISDGTSSEFTKVQSVDSSAVTITVKLRNAHTSGKSVYRVAELSYFQYQKTLTLLSAASDVPILPAGTHLVIPHYAAHLFYKDLEEDDRATIHLKTWEDELDEEWLAFSKTKAGEAGEFTL